MGLITKNFSFLAGAVFGAYVAQNYRIPDMKTVASTALLAAKHYEEKYRKPKERGDDD